MIPFLDLKAQYHSIKPDVDAAVLNLLESCQFALGEQVAAFEKEFGAYVSAPEAIGVNSGTSALHVALLAAGVGPGDEVITVPNTFVATVAAVCYTGAKTVFVDIDPRSFTMDVNRIEAAITPRTKALLPVHLYGQAADMDPIMEIAKRHHLTVIEDAAQAHGAEYKGRRCGSIGDMACFSFYPGKNLGAYGEGGMVTTANPEYARTMRMLRDWGQDRRYHHVMKAFNYRLEGIQGAILRVKLRHLEQWTEARRAHARRYAELLAGSGVITPAEMDYARHVYHIYALSVPTGRDPLQQALQKAGVATGLHYPIPVHMQPGFADLGYKEGDFPLAEQNAATELSLPMFAELTDEQIDTVAKAVRAAVATA
jgi:dTDP-4-amino-4,6-dideoxygalactose transaminase